MSNLVKATLQKIRADEAETPDGDAFPVQFNPSSLKIRITNQIEGGRATAKQVRQQTGNSSRTLTLDLLFDTADEGSTDSPVSVRDKTKQLEQFISTPENNPDPPPKLKFHWGDLTVVGIADSIDVSLEHFAANGFPLRAKVSLSIKEQDPTIVFQPSNRGSSSAQSPGGKSGAPGAGTNLGFSAGVSAGISGGIGLGLSAGVGFGANTGVGLSAGGKIGFALEGEMGAEFAARMGVDPSAWRSLEADLSAGLSLSAGTQVGFNASLNSSPGIGVSSGVNSHSEVSTTAANGLNLSQSATDNKSVKSNSNNATNPDSAGKAMSSLGGVDASINAVKIQQSQQKTQSSVIAFGMDFIPSVSLSFKAANGTSNSPQQTQVVYGKALTRTPLNNVGAVSISQTQHNQSLAPPDRVDPRATTFGQGIPLQPLFGASQTQQILKVYSNRDSQFRQQSLTVPFSNNVATPGWVALPQRDKTRQSVDVLDNQKQARFCQPTACHCGGPHP